MQEAKGNVKMILIKDKTALSELSREKRNKYLQKLISKRQIVLNELAEIEQTYRQKDANNLNFSQNRKWKTLSNELFFIEKAILHIIHLNKLDKFRKMNEVKEFEKQL